MITRRGVSTRVLEWPVLPLSHAPTTVSVIVEIVALDFMRPPRRDPRLVAATPPLIPAALRPCGWASPRSAPSSRCSTSPRPRSLRNHARLREALLDELDAATPAGFTRWLDIGARAGGDPARYLTADR